MTIQTEATGEAMTEKSGWQLIETAPLDGTETLIFREDAGIMLGRWTSPEAFCTDAEIEALGESAFQDGWFAADFLQGCRLESDMRPTHWMPLPAPPSNGDFSVAEPSKDDA